MLLNNIKMVFIFLKMAANEMHMMRLIECDLERLNSLKAVLVYFIYIKFILLRE